MAAGESQERQPREPVSYRIIVAGRIDAAWAERLGGMRIESSERDDRVVTTLTGQVPDQAALIGVLNSLYQIQMTILSVDCESCSDSSDHSSTGLKP